MNVAPTDVLLSATTYVPPTASGNTVVGTLSATDVNPADTFTYSVAGGVNAALFNILGTSLRLSAAGQTGDNLQVLVRVTDSGGLSFVKLFAVSEGEAFTSVRHPPPPRLIARACTTLVHAVRVAPTGVVLSSTQYAPPVLSASFTIGTLSAVDANTSDSHTFSLVGGADAALLAVVGTQLQFRFAGQVGASFSVVVRATDSDSLFFDQALTVTQGEC